MAPSELSLKIRGVEGQIDMVKVLIKYLKLPDPSKRKGLRQFAVNFPNNNRKINNCFDAHRQPPHTDWAVLTAIVNLWAKLGVDAVLRDKLFANGMLEQRMIPLFQEGDRQIRTSILFALSTLTHHGGLEARRTIAELTTPTLVDLIADTECSARNAELGIAVLAHSLGPTIMEMAHGYNIGDKIRIPEVLRDVDGGRICYAVGVIIRRPDVDEEAVSHGIHLLKSLAFYFRDGVLATHTERSFIAALANRDIQVRLGGFLGVLRVGSGVTQFESRQLDPMRAMAISRSPEEYFTPDLMQALRSQYGGLKGGMIYEIADSVIGLDSATMELGSNWDYAEFGRALCKRILTREYSLSTGIMYGPGGIESSGNYFARAADALAKSNDPADAHLPSVLLVKMAMGVGDRESVVRQSAEALKKYPDVAFFYYTQATWTEEPRTALRLSKKGLACSNLTDYVKRGLLHRSAEAGFEMTLSGPLEMAAPGSPAWREGVAILHCAQEDSKAYIEMTSMDQRNLKTIIYTYLCVTFMLEGDKVFKNLDMIRPYLEKLSLAEQIYAVVCRPLPFTERKLAIDLIVPQFAKPLSQWRTAIARLEHLERRHHHHHQNLPADDPDHVLANWLARTALDDEDAPETEFAELRSEFPDVPVPGTSAEDVLVYRCSLCGNPSASLKKICKLELIAYIANGNTGGKGIKLLAQLASSPVEKLKTIVRCDMSSWQGMLSKSSFEGPDICSETCIPLMRWSSSCMWRQAAKVTPPNVNSSPPVTSGSRATTTPADTGLLFNYGSYDAHPQPLGSPAFFLWHLLNYP
ncbi:hypothetical protein FRC10_007308 [Ceratobasidium sp. 414]|nr:hypothetical protein FRC10_007308 [Ceratobasidium sp. 414]